MKKHMTRLVAAGALALLTMALPSCKKRCYRCQKDADVKMKCLDDYESKDGLEDIVDYLETQGYSCKKQ